MNVNKTKNTENERKYLHVRVVTNAKRETVTIRNETFYITVKEKAERGLANRRVRELVAQELKCMPNMLRLIKGAQTPSKTYQLLSNS